MTVVDVIKEYWFAVISDLGTTDNVSKWKRHYYWQSRV